VFPFAFNVDLVSLLPQDRRRSTHPPYMKWGRYWLEFLLAFVVLALQGPGFEYTRASTPLKGTGWTAQRKLAVRYVAIFISYHYILTRFSETTRELWYHGFNNYMTFGQYCCDNW
jgi:mannosidase alpha-like ER degradation enhancer 1